MDAQQLLDHIIIPTLKYMGGNYDNLNARMLLLSTSSVESNCGHKIKQVNGPALGIWQMEEITHNCIWLNCDALKKPKFSNKIKRLRIYNSNTFLFKNLLISPMYSCAMSRLKYAMDKEPLPPYDDIEKVFQYYKRIYNTHRGATTFGRFRNAWYENGINRIDLREEL